MKTTHLFPLAALLATLTIASCKKNAPTPVYLHNPLVGTVWENHYVETPGGEFDSYTNRLLFKTDTEGEIFSIVSVVYYSGDDYGYTWDTTAAMTYRLDTVSNDLFITSDYPDNPARLKYDKDKETLTAAGSGKVYLRVM